MRVLLAGATGAIGRRLVPQLIEAGPEGTPMTRAKGEPGELYDPGAGPGLCGVFDVGRLGLGVALAAAGASFAEVARTTIYVVGLRPELMGELMAGLGAGSARLGIGTPGPTTLIGVASLAAPDLLVEIEVTAVA